MLLPKYALKYAKGLALYVCPTLASSHRDYISWLGIPFYFELQRKRPEHAKGTDVREQHVYMYL
jgi:hypothetical protein